tara:strand:- start:2501 stop:3082 length:582 start_codon:yes stop_codon:yes gene_type:complete
VLNLKKEIKDYCFLIKNSLSPPLINLINKEIYSHVKNFESGSIGEGEINKDIRSVKLTGLQESDIGVSVSKRIIFNELKKYVYTMEDTYREKVSNFYFSDHNYFQFLYYDDKMNGHYGYHVDHSLNSPRSLTILVGLNSKDDYEGGELFIANEEKGLKLDKGDAVCFPSNFMFPHKVDRIKKGHRKVLIIWTQ